MKAISTVAVIGLTIFFGTCLVEGTWRGLDDAEMEEDFDMDGDEEEADGSDEDQESEAETDQESSRAERQNGPRWGHEKRRDERRSGYDRDARRSGYDRDVRQMMPNRQGVRNF